MHGGALGSGAPTGNRNGAFRYGLFTKDAIGDRRRLSAMLKVMRAAIKGVDDTGS